jgi:hypothetical protein
MRFSKLQKFILKMCYNSKVGMVDRDRILVFYEKSEKKAPRGNLQAKIITSSIETLIDNELMIGYGVRTPHRWFIRKVGLTEKGKRVVRKMLGEQLSLKLK